MARNLADSLLFGNNLGAGSIRPESPRKSWSSRAVAGRPGSAASIDRALARSDRRVYSGADRGIAMAGAEAGAYAFL